MTRTRRPAPVSLAAALALAIAAATTNADDNPNQRDTLLVGNWLLQNAMPPFMDELAAGSGKNWKLAFHSTGQKTFPYMNLYYFKHPWAYGDTNVWTTDGRKKLKEVVESAPWNSIVVQPYGWVGLSGTKERLGRWHTDQLEKDIQSADFGDAHCVAEIFNKFIEKHPDATLVVFESLPDLPIKMNPDGSPAMQQTEAGPEPAPDRQNFDFVQHYEKVKYDPKQDDSGQTQSTRDYLQKLMAELKKRFPDQTAKNKLRVAPVAAVYNELEKKAKAGKLPGVQSVNDFYADTLHQRSGLPRYILAATLYATLFDDQPHKLDHKLHNDPKAYRNLGGKNWFRIYTADLGEHLDITPELAQTVNETIHQVVQQHNPK